MTGRPRIGVALLPELDWAADRDRWQRAEALGFDHAWLYDHLAWRDLAGGPWHATVPTLTAAALATERLRVGTLVASPNFRHPVPFAKEMMTVDVVSGGRLNLALGAGAEGLDSRVLGGPTIAASERHNRFVEFRFLLDQLLSTSVISWTGDYYSAVDARMHPGAHQQPRPPMLIAANGPRGIRLARTSARRPGDGWVTLGAAGGNAVDDHWWDVVRRAARLMDEAESTDTQTRPGFVRLLYLGTRLLDRTSVDLLGDHLELAQDLGFTDVVISWPRREEPFAGNDRMLDAVSTMFLDKPPDCPRR